mmetsp:Transcript_51021/g.120853  ORF Transcript_51021/g.120853 Transcript_51021/m.120853 type:complete len:413 (+) Transcript_51021:168-1406(+)
MRAGPLLRMQLASAHHTVHAPRQLVVLANLPQLPTELAPSHHLHPSLELLLRGAALVMLRRVQGGEHAVAEFVQRRELLVRGLLVVRCRVQLGEHIVVERVDARKLRRLRVARRLARSAGSLRGREHARANVLQVSELGGGCLLAADPLVMSAALLRRVYRAALCLVLRQLLVTRHRGVVREVLRGERIIAQLLVVRQEVLLGCSPVLARDCFLLRENRVAEILQVRQLRLRCRVGELDRAPRVIEGGIKQVVVVLQHCARRRGLSTHLVLTGSRDGFGIHVADVRHLLPLLLLPALMVHGLRVHPLLREHNVVDRTPMVQKRRGLLGAQWCWHRHVRLSRRRTQHRVLLTLTFGLSCFPIAERVDVVLHLLSSLGLDKHVTVIEQKRRLLANAMPQSRGQHRQAQRCRHGC